MVHKKKSHKFNDQKSSHDSCKEKYKKARTCLEKLLLVLKAKLRVYLYVQLAEVAQQ